jgi:hypothetical protein
MLIPSLERLYCVRWQCWKPEKDFSQQSRAQYRAGDPDGMCQQCISNLYNSRLGRDEVTAYLKEDEDRRLAGKRLPGQEERKESPARWGRAMHHSEFIAILRKIIPNLYVRDGNIPGDISLYKIFGDSIDYVCYLTSGTMPEYEIVKVNSHDLPIGAKRGWRTVLLRLIKSGLVSESQALKFFGSPTNGEAARFYLSELQNYRQQRMFSNGS